MSTTSVVGRYRDGLARLASAQKPSFGTPAYSRMINRPLGRRFAAAGHAIGLTPNQATAISATLSGAGIALIAVVRPSVAVAIAIAVLLAFGYVMDSVDGQLARLRGGGSRSGEWLDHTIDCVKTSSLHAAVAISWFRFPVSDHAWTLLLPLGFGIIAATTFFGLILIPTLRPQVEPPPADAAPRFEHPLRTYALLPIDYGTICLSFVLLAWRTGFLVLYTVLFVAATGALALALRKWWHELRAIDAAA